MLLALLRWGIVSFNQPLETWMRRREGIVGCHYCPKWSTACRVTANGVEGMERHWISFKLSLLFHFQKMKGLATRDFLWVFVEKKHSVVLTLLWNTKGDTVRHSCDVRRHNKGPSVLPARSLLLSRFDSAYIESQSGHSVQTDEVCLLRRIRTLALPAVLDQAFWELKVLVQFVVYKYIAKHMANLNVN